MLYTSDIPVSTSHGHMYHAISMKLKHFHHCDHDEYMHTYFDVDPLSHRSGFDLAIRLDVYPGDDIMVQQGNEIQNTIFVLVPHRC